MDQEANGQLFKKNTYIMLEKESLHYLNALIQVGLFVSAC